LPKSQARHCPHNHRDDRLLSPSFGFVSNQMAPKRRPANVVRSGNAGNSTKPKPADSEPIDPSIPPRPPPLFPAGYKTPVSVLNEKCQKAGWERPLVDARPNGQKWTGVVTLQKRVSKNIYELEKVRLEPRPALEIDTAQEAKHWAATYALFRVSPKGKDRSGKS